MASKQTSNANLACEDLKKSDSLDKEDYLVEYRKFFEKFADVTGSGDQLPVKVIGCLSVTEFEIPGEILSYTLQYLDAIECPPGLVTPICRDVLEDTRKTLEMDPNAFGKHSGSASSMSLMRAAVSSVHAALRAGLDNERACRLPPAAAAPRSAAAASRNGRRCMEDRHVTIDDFDRLFGVQDDHLTSFYAVYDGHCGPLAASYSAAHLHLNFVNSVHYRTNPQAALREAFLKTDSHFGTKESSGGTTAAVCYLKDNNLLVGWAGDSQALLVGDGSLIQLVNPHKPSREDEHNRILQLGGQVMFDGMYRVNGVLAVSRAIGNSKMKPYISSDPEFASVRLSGFEEFLVLACDGLWDFVTEDEVALEVYKAIEKYPDDIKKVAEHLVQIAKIKESVDNISVIVIFLQDPHKLAEKATWLLKKFATMDASFDNTGGAQTNRFHVNAGQDAPFTKDGLLFELDGFKRRNGSEPATNGKRSSDRFEEEEDAEEDDDLGPETDVDADEVLMSPSLAAARALLQAASAEGEDHGRQETPTPLEAECDAVLDGALVDNVGESGGEDSEDEDEWNYFKGDKKEDSDPSLLPEAAVEPLQQQNLLSDLEDAMNSPLNPEAPPFVPVSPTRGLEARALPSHMLPEEVVAQSPQKPVSMDDINVPEPSEFESEVSTRLHDLGTAEEYLNGHSDNSAMSSQENLKETLHGNEKHLGTLDFGDNENADSQLHSAAEIVNQAEFDRVQKDTTDFCDIQVAFTTHTNQAFEDEGIDEELYERLKNKERDPMSMSFYQEKDEDTSEVAHNPFDLNAVQTLPNDSDEDFSNDQPLPDNSVQAMMCGINPFTDRHEEHSEVTSHEINAAISDLDNAVTNEPDSIDMDYHKAASPLIFEKADTELPEDVQSPISDNVSQLTEPSEHDDEDDHQDLLRPEEAETAVSRDSAFSAEASSPVPSPLEADVELCHISDHSATSPQLLAQSPELFERFEEQIVQSPELVAQSPERIAHSPEPIDQSPDFRTETPDVRAESPELRAESPELRAESPELRAESPELRPQSAELRIQSPLLVAESPELRIQSPDLGAEYPELRAKSPELRDQPHESKVEPFEPKAEEFLAQTPEPAAKSQDFPEFEIPSESSWKLPSESSEIVQEHFNHSSEVPAQSQEVFLVSESPIPVHQSPLALSPEPEECTLPEETYHLPVSHSPVEEHKSFKTDSPEPQTHIFDSKFEEFQQNDIPVPSTDLDKDIDFDIDDAVKLPHFQPPVEQVCEFVAFASVEENVKNVDLITNEGCEPLIEAGDQMQQLISASEGFAVPEPSQCFNLNDSNIIDFSVESTDASQVLDIGTFIDEIAVEKPAHALETLANVDFAVDHSINEVVTGPSDDLINEIVSAPTDHFICEDIITPTETCLLNGIDTSLSNEIINKTATNPLDQSANVEVASESAVAALAVPAAVASVVAAVVAASAVDEKKAPMKARSSTAVKKGPTAAKPAGSPTKPSAPKTTPLSATKKPTSLSAKPSPGVPAKSSPAPKPASAKPLVKTATSPTSKPPVAKSISAPRPRPPPPSKTTPTVEKKPLANGEVKREPIRRPIPGSVPAKPASKPAVPAAAPKPAAGPPKAAAPRPAVTRPASAPRPAPIAAAPSKPRPTPITRAPISKPSVGSLRVAPAAEKLAKETTNKQLSARPTPAPRTAISATKTTLKPASKTTTTTTVTKTNISPIKRPTSAATKTTLTKTTTKTTTVKQIGKIGTEKLNGSLEKSIKEIKQEISMNGSPLITDLPLKDNSPQEMDNSLLPIIDAAAD